MDYTLRRSGPAAVLPGAILLVALGLALAGVIPIPPEADPVRVHAQDERALRALVEPEREQDEEHLGRDRDRARE